MPDNNRLKVVLCWHMHQPEYHDAMGGDYQQPWTYLHAIKDYADMAEHLQAVPQAKAVVNFTPTLLEQLRDYERQINGFLHGNLAIRDPLLSALASPALPVQEDQRMRLIQDCMRANQIRVIDRFLPYKELISIARGEQGKGGLAENPDKIYYLSDQYVADLLVWYHLAWMGETIRRSNPRIQELMDKGNKYTLHDRRALLEIIHQTIASIIPTYKKLAEQGQIELSTTPYAHPIMPLMLDLSCAHDAIPDLPLPAMENYPGGKERVEWHIKKGLEIHKECFGSAPAGCWPSEGSLSQATVQLLEKYGFRWTASGETVLRNSLSLSGAAGQTIHRPYRMLDSQIFCFFRDDRLSDAIGFDYQSWHADDAVSNLIHHLENIANVVRPPGDHVVSIILDGENAWESYPFNGYYFLRALYTRLSDHPRLELTTFSACVDQPVSQGALAKMVAGSWVYGSFSTWIGDPYKNRGWEMLADAKRMFDERYPHLVPEKRGAAKQQLAICEGSDWCWWFGEYNPSGSVHDFDRLYRLQLANLYQILGVDPPDYLAHSFAKGKGNPAGGGTMRRGQ